MKRKKLIAANWKMNGNSKSLTSLLNEILTTEGLDQLNTEIAIFPSYPYLLPMAEKLHLSTVLLGAQNVAAYSDGAYTGEVSAAMLKDLGCCYCLVGHSERRQLFHENNETLAAKLHQLTEQAITPILCVGETLAQREQGETFSILADQLSILAGYHHSFVLAYEPVWAIGTGKTATPEMAQEVHAFIRMQLKQLLSEEAAQNTKILYGGSVKAHNAELLLAMPDIDGALVGGASLDSHEFVSICQCCKSF